MAYLTTYYVFVSCHTLLAVCANNRMNNLAKQAESANGGAKDVEFGTLDGEEHGVHTYVQCRAFHLSEPLDGVYTQVMITFTSEQQVLQSGIHACS